MTGVQAEIDRLKALGMEPTASTYADALSAAAKGNTEQVDALNGVYSEQYAEIMKITDETERKSALEKLNAEYQEQMAAAAERYAAAIAKLTPGAFETPEVKEGAEQFKTLNDLIDKYTKAGSEGEKNKVLEDMANLTKDMDEGTLTSFLATMQQVDSQAQTLKGLNIDPTTIIPTDQLETATTGVKNFSDAVTFLNGLTGPDADKLSGLKEMLSGSVTDELTRLSGSLNLTPTVSIAQGKRHGSGGSNPQRVGQVYRIPSPGRNANARQPCRVRGVHATQRRETDVGFHCRVRGIHPASGRNGYVGCARCVCQLLSARHTARACIAGGVCRLHAAQGG